MVRYLLFFSYIGTKFSGSQRQVGYNIKNSRVSTVQDVIETALTTLRPFNIPARLTGSSRTDTGVHALCSSGHVDLRHFTAGKYYQPDVVTYALNLHFTQRGHAIRIVRTQIVPDDFHCRYQAVNRTYVYRIAVVKKHVLPGLSHLSLHQKYASIIPLMEMDACNLVYPPFDVDAMKRATRLFLGTHNFTTFMKKPSERDKRSPRNPVRNMEICDLSPGTGFLSEHDPFHDNLDYWDITFRSSGFLHRQVRRMVGTLVAVAAGKLTEEDVTFMLNNPSHESWTLKNPGYTPPQGLYLKNVAYNEKDFKLPVDFFDVIRDHGVRSYSDQKNYVYRNLLESLAGRAKQLSELSTRQTG